MADGVRGADEDGDTSTAPLYTLNPLGRFTQRAADYASYRPTYPPEAIALILDGLGSPEQLHAADIGAGTGISARLLAEQGVTVQAIEPNAAMREAAQPHERVTYHDTTAEATGLGDRTLDLITCCQAFHWFQPAIALHEFHRILKPAGRLALMWNDRNLADPFTQACHEAMRLAAEPRLLERPDRKSAEALIHSTDFTHYRYHCVPWQRSLDFQSLVGLILSASYIPQAGPAHDRLMADLAEIYAQWAIAQGDQTQVLLSYNTHVHLAEATV